ncbi:hypothetical protein CVS40_9708 [Lucilia cuprina]|nr:hypothetical protein CVS40_9708 [Lucilia cuprina]
MSNQYDDILKGVSKNTKQIECLKKENKALRGEVKQLKSSVKFLNDTRVRNDCIINGVAIKDNADAMTAVLDLAKQTGAEVVENDIEDAYFLPNRNKKNNKRFMVVKFLNRKSKQVFMNEKAKMKTIDELKSVYVNDFMSRETMEIFNYAKVLKEVGFKFVYARGSKIFAKRDEKAKQNQIRSMDDVDKILMSATGGKRIIRSSKNGVSDVDDDDS